jgi:ATP-binding protein involved in chromosome partitioning
MPTEAQVLDAMRHIIDPDLGRDIVSLGFIKDVQIDGGKVSFRVELTTPACPIKERFKRQCEEAVSALPGVESVAVTMDAMKPKRRTAPEIDTLAEVGAIVAVSSCKGGVGKSTVAAHLALAMARQGLKVALLDADVYGPSIPTLFNLHTPGVSVAGNLIIPVESGGVRLMSMGFLLGESPAVLRGPIVSNYITQVLRQTMWGPLDYLLIDLPPGTGDIQLTITQQAKIDGAIIVTTPQALSLVDVARGILMFNKVEVPVLGVVENMSSFACDGCGKTHHPFGSGRNTLQERFGLPTLAELPILPGFSDLAHADQHADAINAMADNVHRAVGMTRAGRQPSPEVEILPEMVRVTWPDGHEALFDNHALRAACPCAVCVDEYTGDKLLDPASVPADIAVEAVQPLGNYAVSFSWSDGHTTGIYSWDYLRKRSEAGG